MPLLFPLTRTRNASTAAPPSSPISTPFIKSDPARPELSRRALARYFLELGATGFGGPVALVAAMHRDLVERRQWFTEEDYRQGITLAQVSPGPLAAQLCFYLAYRGGGLAGAVWSALAFVLPSFVMVVILGWVYVSFGGLPQIRAVFHGVGAAVTGLLIHSGWRLTQKTVGKDRLLVLIVAAVAVLTIVTGREPILPILAAGLVVWLLRAPPRWLARTTTAPEAASLALLIQIALFFTYAGTFVFGSGLAIVPFLQGGLVVNRGWLTETQFLDAVAVALITPGPVVITTGFVGYLVAGMAGATIAAASTFLPCFVITVLLAPHVERYGGSRAVTAVAAGITAAATGALLGAVVLIGQQTVRDWPTSVIAASALLLVWSKKVPQLAIIAVAAGLGLWMG